MDDQEDELFAGVCEALAAEGRYRVLDRISRGAFGTVVRAKPRAGGPEVAIKCMRLGPNDDGRMIAREILHHEKLLHAHVVRFRECFAAGPYLCIAMELVPGGDLLELVNATRGLPENEARYLFQQLILAVDYCHRCGVMNRDIKPENTLLLRVEGKPPMVKLCDFGYAKSLEDSAPTTRAGTMHYVAPEVLANYKRSVYDGMKADVWSCGVLLYVTLFCTFPFAVEAAGGGAAAEAQQMHEMLRRMARGEFSFPRYRSVSADCKDLIRHMLDPDHTTRFSVDDIKRHPWFLRNLLPGTLAYNDRVLAIPRVPPQSEEEVQRIIDQVLAGSQSSHISGEGIDALQSDDEENMF
ncbi:hypothetical protein ABPG77_007712 [Micractinium sp. CCAP 211/92]